MPNTRFDKFHRYTELTRLLKAYAKEYPDLIRLQSIGKSYEGRDVWLVTATNFRSGEDAEKPALWVDANLHASEVTGSTAAIYLIHTLVTRYKIDANVTRALDTRVFYIFPRVNPDGAEWALADKPKEIRSVTRPYPYMEDHIEGLVWGEDINGDGRILQMRIKDSNGAWKVHPSEPRLMIRRDPIEMVARAGPCLSVSRFKARFKEEVGIPPADYIQRSKIAASKKLLAEQRLTVTAIAHRLGFSTSQNFPTVFKRYTGQSPVGWQRSAG